MAIPGRGNGLRAEKYVSLADLEPAYADAMLELLRDSGIAAYAVSAGPEHSERNELSGEPGDSHGRPRSGAGDSAAMASPAGDRLYVDARAVDRARDVLHTSLPALDPEPEGRQGHQGQPGHQGHKRDATSPAPHVPDAPPSRDDDTIWQEIIAGYDQEPSGSVPPWPASEDLEPHDERGGGGKHTRSQEGDQGSESVAQGSPSGEQEGHYEPPPPPPLPHPDPASALAWLSLFGGPTYLLTATLIGWPIPDWAAFLAVAAFVGGFVSLVLRMEDEPPQDSGPDDGAVV